MQISQFFFNYVNTLKGYTFSIGKNLGYVYNIERSSYIGWIPPIREQGNDFFEQLKKLFENKGEFVTFLPQRGLNNILNVTYLKEFYYSICEPSKIYLPDFVGWDNELNFLIKPIEEVEELTFLDNSKYQIGLASGINLNIVDELKIFKESEGSFMSVALLEKTNEVIGLVIAQKVYEDHYWLRRLFVHEQFRNGKIAKNLLFNLLIEMKKKLSTISAFYKAKKETLFKKTGFELVQKNYLTKILF